MIRKAMETDIPAISAIYDRLHDAEEAGKAVIGWVRGVYPTEATARAALDRGDLFVMEQADKIVGAAIINQTQVPEYYGAPWQLPAGDEEVMVLHTLTIDPNTAGKGYGKAFVAFYEQYARENGCRVLRIDTNQRNVRARNMYAGLGYREIGIVPCNFNGIPGIGLVLLEKPLFPSDGKESENC
ncbi:MAG TPA: GNAT family N-acetyltransferase [Clostridiales bacterium]|mgnify:CR=1 FL=1|nr:GNAT family N-acetyltransferase [Clostridiales bacterium]